MLHLQSVSNQQIFSREFFSGWPCLVSAATVAIGLPMPSISISATHQAITNVLDATSTALPGRTYSTTFVKKAAVLLVKAAMMEVDHTGFLNLKSTWTMWRTSKSALSVRGTSLHRVISIRTFKTYGGMIIHLERGTCSNINYIHLNKLAAECYKWAYFIFEDYRDELLDDGDTEYDCKPFSCPTCDTALSKLSSLFQHAESNACAQTLDDTVLGQLRRFLASRLS
ncbi:unnamed protein product [Alternaria alternata]